MPKQANNMRDKMVITNLLWVALNFQNLMYMVYDQKKTELKTYMLGWAYDKSQWDPVSLIFVSTQYGLGSCMISFIIITMYTPNEYTRAPLNARRLSSAKNRKIYTNRVTSVLNA